MPTTLLDLFSNHLVLAQLTPYLSISALFNLSITSRRFSEVIRGDPKAFQRLDVSSVRGVPCHSCEDEPPESHTIHNRYGNIEEEWATYCLPLMKLATISRKWDVLPSVKTLILDHQYVHLDTLRNILLDSACQIRLLSLLDVRSLDRHDFQDLIDALFRGGPRLDGPRLEGIYYFGAPLMSEKFLNQAFEDKLEPVNASTPAKESNLPDAEENLDPWYRRSGVAFQPPEIESLYSGLLRVTRGFVVWDAVLCRAPRHTHPHPHFLIPTIASVALGATGCHICHSSPEGPGSTINHAPLLAPPPLHSFSVKVAQEIPSNSKSVAPLPFYARCYNCLKYRWCASCNKWWCENCYQFGAPNCYKENDARGRDSAGTKAECDKCGRLCSECNSRYQKLYTCCNTTYCLIHDRQLSGFTTCDTCAGLHVEDP